MPSPKPLENPWYYLDNFEFVLRWIAQRYGDLLQSDEHEFIRAFLQAPQASRGLLVRMIMRKGSLFRASKLQYREIGSPSMAARPLIAAGWVSEDPLLTLDELFDLLTKAELATLFRPQLAAAQAAAAAKPVQLACLQAQFPEARPYSQWAGQRPSAPGGAASGLSGDAVYRENIAALSERLRLMFFGNLRQDWTEFVLSDLGLFTYEKVEFSRGSRAFHTRQDVDAYLHLHHCREAYMAGVEAADAEAIAAVRKAIPPAHENDWLEARRGKLLFQIGQHHERSGNWDHALDCYEGCAYPGARARRIRVLERAQRFEQALELAQAALPAPESEAEQQLLARMMPRLLRRSGGARAARRAASGVPQTRLELPAPAAWLRVEEQVRHHLQKPQAPVFYVENTLITALFGLLCWDAIFAAIPGAFFHPFQQGPADLLRADFHPRRRALFAACFAQLASGQYKHTILRNYACKAGIQSPFVAWDVIGAEVLAMALACIPARHLEFAFERLLRDLRGNRSGLPDLIQFWPAERRYQMIEVKGPGDRLQDNQIRWLDYCHARDMPVAVCYVRYQPADMP
ncbi:VRR-NUC domain-containing protein [Pollutimonas bauzanensis]|nr:VRR-NUC domain-containing protein [Pollutimonas bauzanensis]